ncbi:MAG: two-component system response regulator [Nitrospinae bacterium RIFCSPLOWO2_12_FULL_47_7]|nr:MAG: two-component system response regulator [Nitrospinae bacterium RIFCSPLOWO2_12_FULL_47_7]
MIDSHLTKAKILIIDDEQPNVQILERLLKGAGFQSILCITDGRQAKDVYQQYQPDLILLDLKMPNCDGFEVMAQLRTLVDNDYLPILILTAQRDQPTRLRALESGAKDFLNKPFDLAEGLTRICNMLEVRLMHNQIRNNNKTLEEKVHLRTLELEETRLEVIHRLGRAAEYRDSDTGMHVIRMSQICGKMAQYVGLTEHECQLMIHASPMHDVGKIGIPDHILLKPGKLTESEWTVMKTHSAIGAEILARSSSELMQSAQIIALTHHEKWDGSGYPRGAKGEQIPLSGRIVGICDVFDALTSNRPYKKAWTASEAMTEIESKNGTHFDPYLVTIFKKNLPEIVNISRSYADELVNTISHSTV